MLWVEHPWLGGLILHYMHIKNDVLVNYPVCYSSKQDIARLSGWNGLFYHLLRCEENRTALPEIMYLEYFRGHSRWLGNMRLHFKSTTKGSKTLNCEKKAWEASLSGWFGCSRRILAPQSKSDTSTCENARTM